MSFVSSKGNILCRLINIELYKIFAIINRAIKGLYCNSWHLWNDSLERKWLIVSRHVTSGEYIYIDAWTMMWPWHGNPSHISGPVWGEPPLTTYVHLCRALVVSLILDWTSFRRWNQNTFPGTKLTLKIFFVIWRPHLSLPKCANNFQTTFNVFQYKVWTQIYRCLPAY